MPPTDDPPFLDSRVCLPAAGPLRSVRARLAVRGPESGARIPVVPVRTLSAGEFGFATHQRFGAAGVRLDSPEFGRHSLNSMPRSLGSHRARMHLGIAEWCRRRIFLHTVGFVYSWTLFVEAFGAPKRISELVLSRCSVVS